MNNIEAGKHWKVIKALKKGETVQVKSQGRWADVDNPSFFFDREYRVKPKTKDDVVWENIHPKWNWYARDKDGTSVFYRKKPYKHCDVWIVSDESPNAAFSVIETKLGNVGWKKSLQKRPEGV